MSETELVHAAKAGDLAAFETLYRLHETRIFALCLRMCADRARAEDLTQDAFVRAWEKLPSFRGASTFLTWMHRLTVNVVLGDLRSRGRWEDRFVQAEEFHHPAHTAGDRPTAVGIDLERAIAGLPPKARMVFVLHDVEGYRHKEIAKMTGIAEGTSKAHLHRARTLLRKALNR
jgi:RNA polymerase sigma-70 factor (ECF subfamily)